MPIFSIIFVLLLSCSVVTPPNLVVVVVGGVTVTCLALPCVTQSLHRQAPEFSKSSAPHDSIQKQAIQEYQYK
jgi:hypothetical protein